MTLADQERNIQELHPAVKIGIWIACVLIPWAFIISALHWVGLV